MAIKVISQTNNLSIDLMKVFNDTITDTYQTDSYNIWVEIDVVFEKTIYVLESVDVYVDNGANANQPYGFEVWANGQKIAERLGLGTGGSSWTKQTTTNVKVIEGKMNINTNSVKLRILGTSSSSYKLFIPHITFNNKYISKFLISSEDKTYSLYKNVGKPLIPLMDGYDNAVGSVIGSASYSTGYTWKAFDNDDTTAYGTNFIPDSSKPIYVGFRFNEPVCVKRYSFLAGLRTFKFMASNNGTTWDTLDTQTSLVSNTSTTQTFDIQNDKLYSYYKLEGTLATSGNAWVSIFSVQFYGLMPSILLESLSSEESYIQNGMDKGFQIDTVEVLNVKQHIKEDSIPLGTGKVFKQKIDRSKHKAHKIILG
ncbi:hypothetical protein [Paenibacillus amylolyticus]|uniref:hypothetical protein n=1 Tax=Paenibacillus amylolyticus TaxID=1451 RepID=UPI003D986C62